MIVIFSKSKFEGTTDEVIDWLFYYKADFIRINGYDYFKTVTIHDDENELINEIKEAKVCWFRRWIDDDFFKNLLKDADLTTENFGLLENHLHREFTLLTNELWKQLDNRIWITKPSEIAVKKLDVIKKARSFGLLVPPTLVTTSKERLIEFKKRHGRVISKTIGDIPNFRANRVGYSIKTVEVDNNFIQTSLEKVFFPSLFQALIEKDFELRVFFLRNKFYPMAIFSQKDKQTELDFRNYNRDKPNRVVRYKLPRIEEEKLRMLVSDLKLSTGSIDIIKQARSNNYYFLEINPVGQIGMTSYPCNYYLEREIAKELIKYDK